MTNIIDLLKADGMNPAYAASTHGGEYKSPCPVCSGEDRFRCWPKRDDGIKTVWWCRGCAKSGDVIEYVRYVRNMGYRDACDFLGKNPETVNTRSDFRKQEATWEPRKITQPENTALWDEKAGAFVKWAENNLWDNRSAPAWARLAGFSEKTCRHFHLGWNPKKIYRSRDDWGLKAELKNNGKPKNIWLPKGLVIPSMADDVLVQIKIRPTDKTDPYIAKLKSKYVNVRRGTPCLMPCVGEYFVVVEADLDAMLLWQEVGDLVGIVSLGSLTPPDTETTELLRKAHVVLVALDNDESGAKKAWQWWPKPFPNSRRWPIPKKYGKDPGEAYQNGFDLRIWVTLGI